MENGQIDTIYALASAPGRGGVQIVRVSGPAAFETLGRLTRKTLPPPRQATVVKLWGKEGAELLDQAVVVCFQSPASYTGEDVVELQLHGGRAVLAAVLGEIGQAPGVRLAAPGEFTRRAFENDKMDLTMAEAVADLVDAECDVQRKSALRQLDGELGRLYGAWSEWLKKSLAYSEACLDFSDEELPEGLEEKQKESLRALCHEIEAHLMDNHRGEKLREGFSVAILGAPNAGKSSLLNALVAREAAIVSPIAGTTRDVIEVDLDLGGYAVSLADTAGLRGQGDAIEKEGIRRALSRAEQADLKLLVIDGKMWPEIDPATAALKDDSAVLVVSKADLMEDIPVDGEIVLISTKTGLGLSDLTQRIIKEIEKRFAPPASPVLTRARHREALEEAAHYLRHASNVDQSELRAEDLRLALGALGRITGKVGVEDLLDVIFRDFCIGK